MCLADRLFCAARNAAENADALAPDDLETSSAFGMYQHELSSHLVVRTIPSLGGQKPTMKSRHRYGKGRDPSLTDPVQFGLRGSAASAGTV